MSTNNTEIPGVVGAMMQSTHPWLVCHLQVELDQDPTTICHAAILKFNQLRIS